MNPNSTAFIFPGQGSQALRMGFELVQAFPKTKELFDEANDLLGFSISNLMWEGPEEGLNDTINTQPALLLHSAAALTALNQVHPDLKPRFVAGHSMGELSALLGAKVLTFKNTLSLARTRGRLMKQAGDLSPGGMAAILGLDIPTLENICSQASKDENIVQVANDNCPGQVVISGENSALDKAIKLAQNAGARRAVRLAVSIAAHSPFMNSAQVEFNQAVDQAGLIDPAIPLIGNVSAKPLHTVGEIKADLQAQLTNRVRWTETIQYLVDQGVETFLEVGSGAVLSGLIKRINRDVDCYTVGTPADIEKLS